LPEVDDEFAKDVSEFDNLEQLKADLRVKLEKQQEERIDGEFEDKVLKVVVDSATVDIPEILIENQITQMIKDYEYRLRYQGLDLNKYLEMIGKTIEEFRSQFKQEAEYSVKAKLVLKTIAKNENIVVTEADLENELQKMAEMYKMELSQLKQAVQGTEIDNIKDSVLLGKTLDFIMKQSVAK